MPVKNQIRVVFGSGDIEIAGICHKGGLQDSVGFRQMDATMPIGEDTGRGGDETWTDEFDVVLRFTDADSIPVLIEHLQSIEKALRSVRDGK